MQQLAIGTELQGGKYKILQVLGQGGFGITYLAEHTLLERKVAIKEFFFKDYCVRNDNATTIDLTTTSSSELVERFMNKFVKEAKTISKLKHPNIIGIYDLFKENNTAYYVMEYVDGFSLEKMVNASGVLSEQKAIQYIKQVAGALAYLHERNINHLDIKPANVMIQDSDGLVRLIDFGLSKQYDIQGSQTSTTPVGISHGYAPLEQYNPGGVSSFCPATDIYSLGATLYKLVTGETPPSASDILDDGVPELPDSLSSGIKDVINKSMVAGRKKRIQTIKDFLNILGEEKENKGINTIISKSSSEEDKITLKEENQDFEDKNNVENENTMLLDSDFLKKQEILKELEDLGVLSLQKMQLVDMGLSVKWASLNFNSLDVFTLGNLYSWGDQSGKNKKEEFYLDGLNDVPNDISKSIYDIVYNTLGDRWCIPSINDWKDLIQKCNWKWFNSELINGYIVTGKNGNKIFLPAAGRKYGEIAFENEFGYYWSSNKSLKNHHFAKNILFSKNYVDGDSENAYFIGRSIRPVYK